MNTKKPITSGVEARAVERFIQVAADTGMTISIFKSVAEKAIKYLEDNAVVTRGRDMGFERVSTEEVSTGGCTTRYKETKDDKCKRTRTW